MKKYKYLTSIGFIIVIFAVCFLNVRETVFDYLHPDPEDPPALTFVDVSESLDSVNRIKYKCININGAWQKLTGHKYVYDVARANDQYNVEGYLITANSRTYTQEDLDSSLNGMQEVKKYLDGKGIDLLYVQSMGKKAVLDDEYFIDGVFMAQDQYANYFLEGLNAIGVDVINCRDMLCEKGLPAFFRTDHHWTVETALEVSEDICEHLVSKGYKLDKNKYSVDSYNIDVHEKAFLGTEGRRVGRYYVGLDDIAVITPKYETDFELTVPSKSIARKGPFEQSIMDQAIDTEHYTFKDSAYYMYWGGDYRVAHVVNNLADNDYDVLILKDSNGIPVSAFLANSFRNTHIADLRYYKYGGLQTLVEKYEPDAVIYIYGTGYFNNTKIFSLE